LVREYKRRGEHKNNVFHLQQVTRREAVLAVLLFPLIDEKEWRQINIARLLRGEDAFKGHVCTEMARLESFDVIVRSARMVRRGNCSKLFYAGKDNIILKSGLVLHAGRDFDLKVICGELEPQPVALDVDEMVVAANCRRCFTKKGSISPEDIDTLLRETALDRVDMGVAMARLVKKGVLTGGQGDPAVYGFGEVRFVTLTGTVQETNVYKGCVVRAGNKVDLLDFSGKNDQPKKYPRSDTKLGNVVDLSLNASLIADALWQIFDDKEQRSFDCQSISRELHVDESFVTRTFDKLAKAGFFYGEDGYVRGHGQFVPRFAPRVGHLQLSDGRVLKSGELCDLRKSLDGHSHTLCKGDACEERKKTAKGRVLNPCKGAVCGYRKAAEALVAVSEDRNGHIQGDAKVVVVVTGGPEEAAKLVTCIVNG